LTSYSQDNRDRREDIKKVSEVNGLTEFDTFVTINRARQNTILAKTPPKEDIETEEEEEYNYEYIEDI
jgi:hypothetical protein